MAEAEDEQILRRAAVEKRVVVTLDADFHMLLALSQAHQPSVIRIRVEGLRAVAFADLLQDVIRQCQPDLKKGAVVSVQKGRIRVRRLPIG